MFEIVVYFSLWSLTTGGNQADTRKLLIYYILFYGILHNLQTSRAAAWIGDDISSGQLNHYLTKPINFPLVQVIRTSVILIIRVIVPIIIISIGSVIYPYYLAPANIFSFLLFVLFTSLGLVLWNLLMVIIGTLAFWLTEIRSLVTASDLIFTFLKGAYIPLYLFSDNVKRFISLTPFNYLTAFPIDIYQGLVTPDRVLGGFFIIGIWISILTLVSRTLYSAGIRRYEAYG